MQAFGDGFDCYAALADMGAGYWDSAVTIGVGLVAGRFTGSQCYNNPGTATGSLLTKSSGQNDALHHIVCAFRQTAVLSGTTLCYYFQLSDGATNQVCIVFRSDGTVLLTSATPGGTVLATYTGAVTAANTWYAFEFEVFISPTAGYFNARKNGNTTNDFTSATNLNTRPGTNNYANKLTVGSSSAVNAQSLDDLLWRSDPTSVPWVGDIRCYTRMPASDASVAWSRTPTGATVTQATTTSSGVANGVARYTTFTATFDGTISAGVVPMNLGYTGNLKTTIFADASGNPGAVLGSANVIVNPATGSNTLTFPSPVTVTKNSVYWIGFDSDTSSGSYNAAAGTTGKQSTTTYAAFPVASPSTSSSAAVGFSVTIGTASNATVVNEPQQDGATSYVYDSNVGDADFYAIAALSGTPASTVAVTTRGFFEKSDAGTRNAAVQLKSGGTTVTSTSTALSTSWGWLYRVDLVDPATGSAWTATGVNNAQIGPTCTA